MKGPRIEVVDNAAGTVTDEAGRVVPRWPCQCGGRYAIGFRKGEAMCVHTLPFCDRYRGVVTADDAVKFSRANREALES